MKNLNRRTDLGLKVMQIRDRCFTSKNLCNCDRASLKQIEAELNRRIQTLPTQPVWELGVTNKRILKVWVQIIHNTIYEFGRR